MINLAVFFGGENCEHDISIITGLQFISKVNEYLYNIVPVYIDKNGDWFTGKDLNDIDNYPDNLGKLYKVGLVNNCNTLFYVKNKRIKKYINIDVAVLCLHGINGEDGSIASILEISKIPYVNSSILPSAVGIDKYIFNLVCKGLNINKIDFFGVSKYEFDLNFDNVNNMVEEFGYPIIIKPSRQGSSIGIQVCKNSENLKNMLNKAFEYDNRLVIEKYVDVKKEVNIACFLNKGELVFSKTEEPISKNEILNFDDKYQTSSMDNMKRIAPARIDEFVEKEIKNISQKLYVNLDMFGIVRFDFIIDSDDNLYVNEVNTIPGSMANYLFDEYSYPELIEYMVSNAIIRFELNKKSKINYDSGVLKNGFNGFKK